MDGGLNDLYSRESRFQKEFSTADAIDFPCPASLMRNEVVRLLQNTLHTHGIYCPPELEELHKHLFAGHKAYDSIYGVNGISGMLYDTDEQFAESYLYFITSIRNHFDTPFYFQKTPTIRIHCPDSEGSDFYPCYHNDLMFGHPPEEINLWVPLTAPVKPQDHGFRLLNVYESGMALKEFNYDGERLRAYYSEHAGKDKDLYTGLPIDTEFGKLTAFDSRCIHTAEPLLYHTRVSMDVRILPIDDYDPAHVHEGTGRRKVRYAPGDAYHEKHSHELG